MTLHLMNIQHKILMALPDYLQRSKLIFKINIFFWTYCLIRHLAYIIDKINSFFYCSPCYM